MDQVAGGDRAARLLAVLAVLLGLLAMHGVASAHHAGAATPAAAQTAAHPGPPVSHGHEGEVARAHAAAHAPVAALGEPTCDAECSSVAALCVTVLAGAALALLLARRRAAPLLLAPGRRPARTCAPAVRHARGPDPVRELCVSRT